MITEIQKSIRATLYDRMVGPLSGSLAVAWFVFNWEIIFIAFFEEEDYLKSSKLFYIKNYYSDPCDLFLYPILLAAAFIFIWPYMSNFTFSYYLQRKKERKESKNKIERTSLLSFDESVDLRTSLVERVRQFKLITSSNDEEISNLNEEVLRLKSLCSSRLEENKLNQLQLDELRQQVSDLTKIDPIKQEWNMDYEIFFETVSEKTFLDFFTTLTTTKCEDTTRFDSLSLPSTKATKFELVTFNNSDGYTITPKAKWFYYKLRKGFMKHSK